jgi:DNA gyrase subunit B
MNIQQPEARINASQLSYGEDSIVVLSGTDAIRKRPAMYVGSSSGDGLHQLVFELIENAVDEFLANSGAQISVDLHQDGYCSVTDDGRGIPVSLHPAGNRPTAEILLTQLHSGGKFQGKAYPRSGGLHGLGLTCVNALSERLSLEIWRGGHAYLQEFCRGRPVGDLRDLGETARSGTRIRFLPDWQIFSGDACFSYDRIAGRLRELAFLNEGLSLALLDHSTGRRDEYCFTTGIGGLVLDLNRGRSVLHAEPIRCESGKDGMTIRVALQWTSAHAEQTISFVNSVRTTNGGCHVEGVKRALLRSIARYALASGMLRDSKEELTVADVLEGLSVVISAELEAAEFDSQTKSQLVTPGLDDVIDDLIAKRLFDVLADNSETATVVVDRVLEAQRMRMAAHRASLPSSIFRPDAARSLDVYRQQFGTRSKNWHESCRWLTDDGLLRAHSEMCVAGQGARMLDVCCGSGIVGASFGDQVAYKVGLDITPEMRALASRRLDEVREGSVYDIPFEAGTFDLVVTREVLHLLPEPHRPLREMLRVLRPGGQLIFGQTVPYGAADAVWMFRIFKKKQPLFCNNFLAEELQALLSSVGFERIETKEYLLWEPIDLWIDTHETTALHRQEIRDLYHGAPADVRELHPFEIAEDGKIRDQWRWCIYSARKQG